MAIERIAVGNHLYLFTSSAKEQERRWGNWGAVPNAIIDSHGMRSPTNSYFRVRQGQTIKFYVNRHTSLMVGEEWGGVWGPDSYHVIDSVRKIAEGGVHAVEEFHGGDRCPDYWLDKQVKSEFGHQEEGRYDSVGYSDLEKFL